MSNTELNPGSEVQFKGLTREQHLNGERGVLKMFYSTGRHAGCWTVCVKGEKVIAVKPENLNKVAESLDVRQLLEGKLPRQSAVFVTFAAPEKVIHVNSIDVTAKYSILREIMDCEHEEESPENKYIEREFARCDLHGDDVCGLFMGLSPETLKFFEKVARGDGVASVDQISDALSVIIRTTIHNFVNLPCDSVQEILRRVPLVKREVHGSVKTTSKRNDDHLRVTVCEGKLTRHSYLVCKIDQPCDLIEAATPPPLGSMLDDVELSNQWTAGETENIRSNALKLIRLLVSKDLDITEDTRFTIFAAIDSWSVRIHKHETIN